MSNDSIIINVDSIKVQDSLFSILHGESITLNDLKEEIIANSDKVIDANEKLGFPGYLSLFVTGIFGLLAFWFYIQQKKQGKKLANRIEELQQIEDEIILKVKSIEDINRNVKTNFPELIASITELCHMGIDPTNDVKKFYIMNRTSSFGKIHTYNPKFIKEYKDKFKLSTDDKAKIKFSEEIDKLKKLIIKSSNSISDFKLVVYDGETKQKKEFKNKLITDFIYDYFQKEDSEFDINNGNGLTYYEIDKNLDTINNFKLSHKRKKVKIKQTVQSFHNDTIKLIDKVKSMNTSYRVYDENIPMQIYLLNFIRDGNEEYHSLIIFAEDDDENGDSSRTLSGVHSQEKKLYVLFEKIYNHTYQKTDL